MKQGIPPVKISAKLLALNHFVYSRPLFMDFFSSLFLTSTSDLGLQRGNLSKSPQFIL